MLYVVEDIPVERKKRLTVKETACAISRMREAALALEPGQSFAFDRRVHRQAQNLARELATSTSRKFVVSVSQARFGRI